MSSLPQIVDNSYLEKFHYIISSAIKEKDRVKHTILIVDDEEDNLQLLNRTLRRKYNIITAKDGTEGLDLVQKYGMGISLIISDQRMPNMTGTEFLSKTIDKYPQIVKMLLTGYADIDAMIDGVNKCGLFQYIAKPFEPEELEIIINSGIEAYELTLSKNTLLMDLKELFFTTIKTIAGTLDAKDTYTHGHSHRVTLYSLIISKELALEENYMEEIEIAGLLHDIGKIGIPEDILRKPGKLTDEEYNTIKLHTEYGKKILNGIKKLSTISLWLSSHHERWDGRGYPSALTGKEIPLPARILAIADTYDAMTSNRSYRTGLSHETAVEEIKRCAGSQFDPEIVEAFLRTESEIKKAINDPVEYYSKYSILVRNIENPQIKFI